MDYKLLLTDLDGTLVPELGMPPKQISFSLNLTEAIKKAKSKIAISLCTGRDIQTVMSVVRKLGLTGYHVVEGGAKIIDSKGRVIWVKYINVRSVIDILSVTKQMDLRFSLISNGIEITSEPLEKDFEKVTCIIIYHLKKNHLDYLKKRFSKSKDIAFAANSDRSESTLFITHQAGTKASGINKLFKIMKVKKIQSIGVGNGENDIVLLKSCGLKVAMGNSIKPLKDIADYVTNTVQRDGLVDVIEEFIL